MCRDIFLLHLSLSEIIFIPSPHTHFLVDTRIFCPMINWIFHNLIKDFLSGCSDSCFVSLILTLWWLLGMLAWEELKVTLVERKNVLNFYKTGKNNGQIFFWKMSNHFEFQKTVKLLVIRISVFFIKKHKTASKQRSVNCTDKWKACAWQVYFLRV